MGVSLKQWQKMFDVTADLLLEHEEELSKIDAVIGDGDHGLTIAKIARLMKDKATKEYDSAEAYFDDLGWDAINVQGGSAGPLFGTWLSGMKNAPEGAGVAEVLENALEELRTISQAKVGEKTMMDAIIPATEAANAAADDASAKYGRAKNYGEQSLGVKDAGACSIALIFQGLRAGYNA